MTTPSQKQQPLFRVFTQSATIRQSTQLSTLCPVGSNHNMLGPVVDVCEEGKSENVCEREQQEQDLGDLVEHDDRSWERESRDVSNRTAAQKYEQSRLNNRKKYRVSLINEHIRRNHRLGSDEITFEKQQPQKNNSFSLQIPLKIVQQPQESITMKSYLLPLRNKPLNPTPPHNLSHSLNPHFTLNPLSHSFNPHLSPLFNPNPTKTLNLPLNLTTLHKSITPKSLLGSNPKIMGTQNLYHMENLRKLQNNLSQEKLEKRLTSFSKEKGKNCIRVYKDDLHKIIVLRFGKDRLTTFLVTQYIQDFNSVLKTMNELVRLKRREMLVLCFLIFDQNKDGLITIEDITSLLGIKQKTQTSHNPLIFHDIVKIHTYIESKKKSGDPVLDKCTNPILKDQCLTFMKYRIDHFKKKKQQASGTPSNKCFLSTRLHTHLYSLRDQQHDEKGILQAKVQQSTKMNAVLQNILNMNSAKGNQKDKYQFVIGEGKKFAIGFERFGEIFMYDMPRIFLDFLFLLGGLELPQENYLAVDTSVLEEHVVKEKVEEEQVNLMEVMQHRLKQMTEFNKNMNECRIRTRTQP